MVERRRRRKKKIITRRQKEFSYRGHSFEELKNMPKDEIMSLFPARIRRSLKRLPNENQEKFWEKVKKGKKVIETHRRDIVVLPELVGRKVGVHNGKEFKIVEITSEMIGHYLGEFALTRKFGKHSGPGIGATRSSKYMPLR